jgi:hypothetical protein
MVRDGSEDQKGDEEKARVGSEHRGEYDRREVPLRLVDAVQGRRSRGDREHENEDGGRQPEAGRA